MDVQIPVILVLFEFRNRYCQVDSLAIPFSNNKSQGLPDPNLINTVMAILHLIEYGQENPHNRAESLSC
jgi:hypothetical protein